MSFFKCTGRCKMINLNKLARKVTLKEGGKQELSIAQVKEVMRLTFEELAKHKLSEVLQVIERYE